MSEEEITSLEPKKTVRQVSFERIEAVTTSSGPGSLFDKLVDSFASKEIAEREITLTKAITTHEALTKELKKIRPDQVLYNDNGSVASEGWTKPVLERRKKLLDNTKKLGEAINAAFEEQGGYVKLRDLLPKIQTGSGEPGKGETTTETSS